MATIDSIITTGARGSGITFAGVGFGAAQGNSTVIFWPVEGASVEVSPTSWSDTSIQATIPTAGTDEDLGEGFFTIVVAEDPAPARSPSFTLVHEEVAPSATYVPDTRVLAPDYSIAVAPSQISVAASLSGSAVLTGAVDVTSGFTDVYSLRLGGVEENVNCGNVLGFEHTQAFSVSVWFRRPSVAGEWKTLVGKGSAVSQRGWHLAIDSYGQAHFRLMSTFGEVSDAILVTSTSPISTDSNWHHLVATYNGSGLSSGMLLYLDGVAHAVTPQGTLTGTIVDTSPLHIGASGYDTSTSWWGRIDDVAIYNTTLTLGNITEIYNGGMPRNLGSLSTAVNLEGWWLMGDADTLPTVLDHSGNDYNGTAINMTQAFNRLADTPASPEALYVDAYSTNFEGSFSGGKYAECNSSAVYSFEYTQPFTISAWIKVNPMIEGGPWVITGKQGDSPTFLGYSLMLTGGRTLYFEMVNSLESFNRISVETTATMMTGNWYLVTVTYDGSGLNSGLNLYINGVGQIVNRSGTLSGTVITTAPMRIGARASVESQLNFPGQIDEVIYYNKQLTDGMIEAIQTPGYAPADVTGMDGLIGWWRMGDGDTHPTILDHGPYLSHCTMYNMTSGDFVADAPPSPVG